VNALKSYDDPRSITSFPCDEKVNECRVLLRNDHPAGMLSPVKCEAIEQMAVVIERWGRMSPVSFE